MELLSLSSPPKLAENTILAKRWKVVKKLAEGGFGAVYEAEEMGTTRRVAVKIESAKIPNQVLKIELAVLLRLRGKAGHACGVMGNGVARGRYNYIVMTLVGPSLADLHRQAPARRLKEATVVRLAVQCLRGIQELHDADFVHRDIKPGNFALGLHQQKRTVYILDFGLARFFRMTNEEGERVTRPPRDNCGFRGTVRYASTNAHDGLELGRHDDIWSLFYVLIELHLGKLPWRDMSEDIDVGRMKRRIGVVELIGDMDRDFRTTFDYVQSLRYDQKPKYDRLYEQFAALQKRKNILNDSPFEWEQAAP